MRKRTPILVAAGLVIGTTGLALAADWHLTSATAMHRSSPADVASHDVAIVLGAGMFRPGVPSDVLADRLQLALDLHRAHKVKAVLVSGDNDGVGIDEVNPMRTWLVERGVPSTDIYMDHAGFRTHDTMQRAARVFEVSSAIVCTQEFHLSRSVYLARAAGIDAVGVAAPERRWRQTWGAQIRETLARVKAVADVMVDRSPRHLGEPIPIDRVPASATHDSSS